MGASILKIVITQTTNCDNLVGFFQKQVTHYDFMKFKTLNKVNVVKPHLGWAFITELAHAQ